MRVCPFCRLVLGEEEPTCPRDGHAPAPSEERPLAGELSARFAVVAPYASGTAGDLYLADDRETGRRGILKVLRLPDKVTPAERTRLKRELTKQATLDGSVLAVPLATGAVDEAPWIFREWYEGVSLRVRLARNGAMPVTEALAVGAHLASALDELHRAGLLHRDLKAGHVILNPQPSGLPDVALIDAGVASRVDVGTVFDVVGTPEYLSPEQARGKLVSFRSDLYALGCLLYEMLTGAPPFAGTASELLEAHAKQDPPSPSVAHLPADLATLITKLLAKEPRDRPFSAQQVRRALEPFLPETRRDATQTFEKLTDRRRTPAAGSGTLRPPEKRGPEGTMMGIPAPQSNGKDLSPPVAAKPSAPPPPPPGKAPSAEGTEELLALDLDAAEQALSPDFIPGVPTKPARPDSTEELSALDLDKAEEVLARAPRIAKTLFGMPAAPAGRISAPPPPPPGARAGEAVASAPPPPPPPPSPAPELELELGAPSAT
ncbi:MAG: serine/threonine protein kinase, partial [Sandaracinaceae bacterium]|nr:serine/threonine protein kinase [Sandaracinaceae bacterium]